MPAACASPTSLWPSRSSPTLSSLSVSRCISLLTSGDTTITATPMPIAIQPIVPIDRQAFRLASSRRSRRRSPRRSCPATKLPTADAKNHAPMIRLAMWRGASRFIADRPTGDRHSSPVVCSRVDQEDERCTGISWPFSVPDRIRRPTRARGSQGPPASGPGRTWPARKARALARPAQPTATQTPEPSSTM